VATSPSWFGNYSDRDQPTLNTVADYIKDARIQLQDRVPPYRYEDDSLITGLNLALLEGYRLRSDLFVFNLAVRGQVQSFKVVDDTYVEMEPQFRQAFVDGLIGHALARDQEDYEDQRATTYLNMFTQRLVGHGVGPISGGSPPTGKRSGKGA
jgi:hypothetical protein